MTSKLNKFLPKLGNYHIILLGCILGCLLILNSNNVNNQKAKIKSSEKEDIFFKRLISKRILQEVSTNNENEYEKETNDVCSRASEGLKEYYVTSDLSKIDLDNAPIKCEDKDEEYMKALIDLVRSLVGGDKEENNSPVPDGNLRNLLDDEDTDNLITYGQRILPMLIFLGIGLLSIIGFLVCWICCCCDCCCCCCCKKEGCKIPCFIFTYIFYALVIVVCIYGLTQASKIFTGLANTECSFLQFFNQILYGEKKETPKWIGIQEIDKLLNNLEKTLKEMKDDNLIEYLDDLIGDINDQRKDFMDELQNLHTHFYEPDGITPLSEYCIQYPTTTPFNYYTEGTEKKYLKDKYVLDLIPALGKYNFVDKVFEPGLIYWWNNEIAAIDDQAKGTLEQARSSFESMLNEKLDTILDALKKGQNELGKLKKPFNNAYGDISSILYDYSEIIDSKGKLAVNLVFGLLAFMNICLAALMLLICMFSGQSCVECGFFRCLFKFATHILWNVLAILMILSFIIGSLLALVGRVGGDMMSLVSFIVSEENFQNQNNPVLLNELGEGKEILEECIIKNGNLSSKFGLDDVTGDFDTINEKKTEIEGYIETFKDLAMNYPAYHALIDALKNKTEFIEDTSIISTLVNPSNDVIQTVELSKIITALNNAIGTISQERWDEKDGDKNIKCNEEETDSAIPDKNLLHPWTCEPEYRNWVSGSTTNEDVKNYAKISTDIIKVLKFAENDYYDHINNTKYYYELYLNGYLRTLNFFDQVTGDIINALKIGIGSSTDTFSFLNGKFIGTNLKIILKYLKYSLGEDLYTVGVCLIIVGCSLILSISSTILLIVIINIGLKKNQESSPNTGLPNFAESNNGNIVKYQN